MNFFPQRTIIAGRILAVLFVLANSGFTAVLHQCAMESKQAAPSDQSMECCDTPDRDNDAACEVSQGPSSAPHGIHFTCHTSTIVGGMPSTSALLSEQSKTQLSKFGEWSANFPQHAVSRPIINRSFTLDYFAINATPPSVEKCVLNSSFLI
jgi:hypothetical protein